MLAALCEPVLTLAGRSAATYREVAERLGTTAKTARTCLDGLRTRLADVDGIPGLRTDEDDGGTGGYLDALAGWALASGEVTAETLAVLDAPPR